MQDLLQVHDLPGKNSAIVSPNDVDDDAAWPHAGRACVAPSQHELVTLMPQIESTRRTHMAKVPL
jgi:hypothetical protein